MTATTLCRIFILLFCCCCGLAPYTLGAQTLKGNPEHRAEKAPMVLDRLNLKPRQQKAIDAIRADIRRQVLELQAAGELKADAPAVQSLRLEEARRVETVLTAEQRERLKLLSIPAPATRPK